MAGSTLTGVTKKRKAGAPAEAKTVLDIAAKTVSATSLRQGADLTATVGLSEGEAASGCSKVLELSRLRRCIHCLGLGRTATHLETTETLCDHCKATGRTRVTETIRLEFDPGMHPATITVPGKGDAGERGGPVGSLLVEVKVQSHPLLESLVEADGGSVKLRQLLWKEDLGKTITVPTFFGDQLVPVPAEVPEWPLRIVLPQRGLYDVETQQRADITVVFQQAPDFDKSREDKSRHPFPSHEQQE
jgi:molecular chaperone DnaJ